MGLLKKILGLLAIFLILSVTACSSLRSNKEEFVWKDGNSFVKQNPVYVCLEEGDRRLGQAIVIALTNKGMKVIALKDKTVPDTAKQYSRIEYMFQTGISSFSMTKVLKIVDVYVYDNNNNILARYNWKIRYNKANSPTKIGEEFAEHLVK